MNFIVNKQQQFKELNVFVVLMQDMNNHPHRPVANISHFWKSMCHVPCKCRNIAQFTI